MLAWYRNYSWAGWSVRVVFDKHDSLFAIWCDAKTTKFLGCVLMVVLALATMNFLIYCWYLNLTKGKSNAQHPAAAGDRLDDDRPAAQ